MRSICLTAAGERRNCLTPVGDIVGGITGGMDFFARVRDCFDLLDETVTGCDNNCDEFGRLEVCANGRDVYWLRCPLLNLDCAYGGKIMAKIKVHAFNSLRTIIPKKIQKNIKNPADTITLYKAGLWNFSGVLYLHGDTGLGKSFCAAWLLYNRKVKQCADRWDNESSWGNAGGIAWVSAYSAVDKANFEWVKNVPVLVIDDLGTEVQNPANRATVAEIISKRYDNDVPTIITSNLELFNSMANVKHTCEGLYGTRVVDRIVQSGKSIHFTGASMRVSAA